MKRPSDGRTEDFRVVFDGNTHGWAVTKTVSQTLYPDILDTPKVNLYYFSKGLRQRLRNPPLAILVKKGRSSGFGTH